MQRTEAERAAGLLCQLQGTQTFSSLIPEGAMVLLSTLTSLTNPSPHTPAQESTMIVLNYRKNPEDLQNILGPIYCSNPTSHHSSSPL